MVQAGYDRLGFARQCPHNVRRPRQIVERTDALSGVEWIICVVESSIE